MKKVLCFALTVLLVLSCASALFVMPTTAEDEIKVAVNGQALTFDQPPIIENGRTLVPFRAIFEALGATVDYDEFPDEDGGRTQVVTAQKGMKYVYLEIGSTEIFVNGEYQTIDVPAKIVNDRTLVPARAVSEALGAAVDWDNDTRTVIVETNMGLYTVNEKRITKEYKAEDGTLLASVDFSYPEIDNPTGDEAIAKWNEEFESDVNALVTYVEEEVVPDAKEEKAWRDEEGYEMSPFTFEQTVEVTLNRKGLLSITEFYYYYTGGAHPNSARYSHTFDMVNKKELTIADILKDENPNERMMNAYADMIDQNEYYAEAGEYKDELKQTIKESLDHVSFCLTDTGMLLYFMPYDVASYAEGYIEATIPYERNEDAFAVDLSGGKVDVFEFSLPGNPTTGFEWLIAKQFGCDRIAIEESYQTEPGKENMPGAGGTYTYRVKGLKPGNVHFYLGYTRSWEDERAIDMRSYCLFVDSDLKITVIGEGQVDPEIMEQMGIFVGYQRIGELEIELDGNPTTGYVWTVEADPEWAVEIEETYESDSTDEMLSGVGGTYTYYVTGVEPGEVTLTFTYARPWESVQPWQKETYRLLVNDDLTITVLDHESIAATE